VNGPYDTRGQALAAITPATGHTDRAWRYDMLKRATAAANPGEFDRLILSWLAGWEPDTVQVVIGLLERMYAAGRNQLAAEIADLHARIATLETAARHGAPIDLDHLRHEITNGGAR
jgi:hypothetical protein